MGLFGCRAELCWEKSISDGKYQQLSEINKTSAEKQTSSIHRMSVRVPGSGTDRSIPHKSKPIKKKKPHPRSARK